MKNNATVKKPLSPKGRNGLFSVGMVAIVVAAVLVFNVVVAQLPTNLTQFDVSSTKIYTMTDTTTDYLSALDRDVELVVLADRNDVDTRINTFLTKFAALSDHVTVSYKDPTQYPSLLTEYGCDSDSIEVICAETGRQTNVLFTDILVPDYYSYYYSGTLSYDSFDGEGQLVSAIDQVVSNVSHTLYLTTNHGESSLGSETTDLLTKNHFSTAQVSLLMEGLPSDCEALMIYCPTSDLTSEELTLLRSYLAQGGQVELVLDWEGFDHPNLDALMADYGLAVADGYIGDMERYMQAAQSYFVFFPQISTSSAAASGLSSDSLALIYPYSGSDYSLGLVETGAADDSITLDKFLTTSENGVAVLDSGNYTQGQFILAATATQDLTTDDNTDDADDTDEDAEDADEDTTTQSRFTVYSCSVLFDDDLNSQYADSIVNLQLFVNNLTAGFDDTTAISIPAKSLAVTYNTITNAGLWGLIFLAVLPLGVLIAAFIRWNRRRKL
jgi:ABC-2 type transport system permease protein